MDQSQVSPGKFSQLPEDIRARIIRPIAGAVSRTHRDLTIAERIEDAGTKPFLKEEVEWLVNAKREVLLFYGTHGNNKFSGTAEIELFTMSFEKTSTDAYLAEMLDIRFDDNKIEFDVAGTTRYSTKEAIIEHLIGRVDISVIKDVDVFLTGYTIEKNDESEEYAEEYEGQVNMVLTDIKSIYMILYRRFIIISPDKMIAINYARTATRKILDNIVDDFAPSIINEEGSKLPALLGYLLFNIRMLDVDIDYMKYIKQYNKKVIKKNLQSIQEECTKLYEILSDETAHLY